MNGTRIGLAILLVAAVAAWPSFQRNLPIEESHRASRQIVLHYTLSRTDNPIVVLGDSIVEASTLPRSLCGRPVVNAGLSRASTASDLGTWLIDALGDRQMAAVVVALGINDALVSTLGKPQFQANYGALLKQLSTRTKHLFVLAIPQVEADGRITPGSQADTIARIGDYNSVLPELAASNGATFIALPPMPRPHTLDGVHLDVPGDAAWEQAIVQGVSTICRAS